MGEDKVCTLMRLGFCWHDDKDDEEGEQRRPQSELTEEWKSLSVAVEEECKDVDDLVADEDMPRLNGTVLGKQSEVTPFNQMCSQIRVSQLPAANTSSAGSQCHTGGGEDATSPRQPSGQVGSEAGISPRCQLASPEVLATCSC